MSITAAEKAKIEAVASFLIATPEHQIDTEIHRGGHSILRDDRLGLGYDGRLSSFYAPFEWVNDDADVVLVGITPGADQAVEALKVMRSALKRGDTPEIAAEKAKQAASFKGTMRTLGARLMDHLELNKVLGLSSTLELFGAKSHRAHYTSLMRNPVLKDSGNYSGDARLLTRPFTRELALSTLPSEIERLKEPWIIPFGVYAAAGVEEMVRLGLIDGTKVLAGILHPGGQQWNRYNIQLDVVSREEALKVPGGEAVLEVTAALREKVKTILAAEPALAPAR